MHFLVAVERDLEEAGGKEGRKEGRKRERRKAVRTMGVPKYEVFVCTAPITAPDLALVCSE